MMKSMFVVSLTLFCPFLLLAQVGIGNTNPNATLDISASNVATPANNDGLLIPRVDEFPATDPVAASDGMMLFATGNGSVTRGFYYWDNSITTWIAVSGGDDIDWYEEGTTSSPNDINDDIFHLGNVGIGKNTAGFALDIEEDTDEIGIDLYNTATTSPNGVNSLFGIRNTVSGNSGTLAQFGMENWITGTDDNAKFGVSNRITGNTDGNLNGIRNVFQASGSGIQWGTYNWFLGGGTGVRYGVYNDMRDTGSGALYGVLNTFPTDGDGVRLGMSTGIAGTGNGNIWGTYSSVSNSGTGIHYGSSNVLSGTGSGDKYGSYNFISSAAGGTHYGLYSNALKSGSYAGYFLGTVRIGTSGANMYSLPSIRGTANQVMQTDGAGNINWVDPSSIGAGEWTDGGTAISPADGTGENVTIGTLTETGRLTVEGLGAGSAPAASFSKTSTAVWSSTLDVNATFTNGGIGTHSVISGNSNSSGVGLYGHYNDFSGVSSNGSAGIYGASNVFSGSGTSSLFGYLNSFSGTHSGTMYGLRNSFTTATSSTRYGVYNSFSNSATGTRYGVYTHMGGGNVNKYGYYVTLSSSGTTVGNYGVFASLNSSSGFNYGLYSFVSSSNVNSYAAYLLGKVYMNYRLGIGTTNPSYQLQLSTNSAAKPTSSAWTVVSDQRLKRNIKPFSDGLNVLSQINPVWFTYNGMADMPNETGVGTLAQEMKAIAPYMVKDWEHLSEDGKSKQSYLGVDYGAMDFILINAIKEQQQIIEDQNSRIKSLEERLERLEALTRQ